jgi:hypothetical protein
MLMDRNLPLPADNILSILDKSAHGLRKPSATIGAEIGATEHELMALFGWFTPDMAALYIQKAWRKPVSLNAWDRPIGRSGELSIPSPDDMMSDKTKTAWRFQRHANFVVRSRVVPPAVRNQGVI